MTIGKIRGETLTLATGRAFATVKGIPPGFNTLEVDVPSATLEVILVLFAPKIKRVYFYDASAARWTEYTQNATDRNTASLIDLSAMQTADRLYVGTVKRSEGLSVDVVGTNAAGTANMVGEYPALDVWTSLSITDGTDSTATLDQDGLITWASPANNLWQARALSEVSDEAAPAPATELLYWVRLRPDAAITDTAVTVAELTALATDTINTLLGDNVGIDDIRITTNNHTKAPYRFPLDLDEYGAVEMVSTSITSAANLNWLALR